MKCRSCQAEIAEKAIVCYRCGTPTAIPAPAGPVRGRQPASRSPVWMLVLLLAVVGAGVWLVPQTEPGTSARWAAWGGLVVAAVVVILFWRRRR